MKWPLVSKLRTGMGKLLSPCVRVIQAPKCVIILEELGLSGQLSIILRPTSILLWGHPETTFT